MTNAELLDLLREARAALRCPYPEDAYCHCETCEAQFSIDAALAERQNSAKDVVESEEDDGFGCCGGSDETPPEHTQDCSVHPPNCYLCKRVKATQQIAMGDAYASVCAACAEKAAIAAARGLR
jgi:hypothetical protein